MGVTYLSKVPIWSLTKGQTKPSHLAFVFTIRNLSNLRSFTVTLFDSDGKEIKFPQDEKKIAIIGYRIEIIK